MSILFCDLVESTALAERLDPEVVRSVMARYFDVCRRAIEAHGGTVEKFIGDAVMAVFGTPVVHEDDAMRAVRAATDIREAIGVLNADLQRRRGLQLQVRIAINTGPVVAGDGAVGHVLVSGDAVNTAARIQQAAEPGEILLGEITHRLVHDHVSTERAPDISAKGKTRPVTAYRVLEHPAIHGFARTPDAPLVGRRDELSRLRRAWAQVSDGQTPGLVTVTAPAGGGKSRLLLEFLKALGDDALVLRGRCLSYGSGITYWPIGEALRNAASIDEADGVPAARDKLSALMEGIPEEIVVAQRLASAIGLSSDSAPQEEIFWAMRRFLEHQAAKRPTILVVEDIHWAEPALLDLLEYVMDRTTGVPLLVLCASRPDLLLARPAWATLRTNLTISLDPLPPAAVQQLLAQLPGGSALPELFAARIAKVAEGNPLFLEQMVAMLRADGMLAEEHGRWVARPGLDEVAVPPSVAAVVAARIDGLPVAERAVAQRGAVIGRVFDEDAVRDLSPNPEDVEPALAALLRQELISTEISELTAGEAFKFRHVLLRDAAYEALPKSDRARLHARYADWLERTAGQRITEYQEIVGHHLELAHRYRTELMDSGKDVDALARRAAEQLELAGGRALRRDDISAATGLLRRALALAGDDRTRLLSVAPDLARALIDRGDLSAAHELLTRASDHARLANDRVSQANLTVARAEADLLEGSSDSSVESVQMALKVYRPGRDDRALARAWWVLALRQFNRGQAEAARVSATRSFEYASAAADPALVDRARGFTVGYALYGTVPVRQVLADAQRALDDTAAGPWVRADVSTILAVALAMDGQIAEARELYRATGAAFDELGATFVTLVRCQDLFVLERAAGDVRNAREQLMHAKVELTRLGADGFLSTVEAQLAHVVLEDGDVRAAADLAHHSSQISAADDFQSQVLWRTALARVAAAKNDPPTAERLAREALGIVDRADFLSERAWTRVSLAKVLQSTDRSAEAQSLLDDALALFTQKGDRASAGKTRSLIESATSRNRSVP